MIFKLGGSILTNLDDLEFAANKIAQYISTAATLPIIVISAFKNHTDDLVRMSKRVGQESDSFVVTVGEQITAGLFAQALQKHGVCAKALTGWQVPIIVSPKYEDHLFVDPAKINALINDGVLPVVTGFQGVDEAGNICDLGRGGSDLTAIYLAKVFNTFCVLLKSAGGVCSADPELIQKCFVWEKVGYDNLLQMANAGSRVVQKDALLVAKAHNVIIKVTGIDFKTQTIVSAHNQDFWSVFDFEHKLRVVATNNMLADVLDQNGFKKHDGFYQFHKAYFDMELEAHKIYDIIVRGTKA